MPETTEENRPFYIVFKKKHFIYLFSGRGEGMEKERERNTDWLPVVRTCNPGMCPDWESNWQPFGSQASAQFTEPQQPGHFAHF